MSETFDPTVPVPDPFPALAAVNARCPVARFPTGICLVTGYDNVATVFRDPAAFSNRSPRPLPEGEAQQLVHLDGDEHTRVRRLINKAFTERAVADAAPRIEQLADDLIDAFAGAGEVDLVSAFTQPLPTIVFCELLGIPADDRKQFVAWADEAIEHTYKAGGAPSDRAFRDYIVDRIEKRRVAPGDDLLSRLVHVEEETRRLTVPELVAMVRILIIAGTETTTNLMSTLFHNVLGDPALRDRIAGDAALVPGAVEEALRIDPPLNWVPRLTAVDTELDGTPIVAETVVANCVGHANHDPAVFADPDRFDIDRHYDRPHLTFGYGAHFCVGAPLARLEARTALTTVLRRLPGARVRDGYRFEPRGPLMMRGCRSLPVVW